MEVYVVIHRWGYEDFEVMGVVAGEATAETWRQELMLHPEFGSDSEYCVDKFILNDQPMRR